MHTTTHVLWSFQYPIKTEVNWALGIDNHINHVNPFVLASPSGIAGHISKRASLGRTFEIQKEKIHGLGASYTTPTSSCKQLRSQPQKGHCLWQTCLFGPTLGRRVRASFPPPSEYMRKNNKLWVSPKILQLVSSQVAFARKT